MAQTMCNASFGLFPLCCSDGGVVGEGSCGGMGGGGGGGGGGDCC